MRHGYYACVSFIDSLIGEILDVVEELSLDNNTIIIIASDHGYHIGEHAMWNKHRHSELALRVPLFVKIPGVTEDKNGLINGFVENIDLFPTLVEASGLPLILQCPEDSSEILVCHEGLSMMGLINGDVEPNEWKSAIYSQYFKFEDSVYTQVMGYSIRDYNFQYTKWIHFENNTANWSRVYGSEMYDLVNDPNQDVNVVDYPEYIAEQERLDLLLRAGWRSALPNI